VGDARKMARKDIAVACSVGKTAGIAVTEEKE